MGKFKPGDRVRVVNQRETDRQPEWDNATGTVCSYSIYGYDVTVNLDKPEKFATRLGFFEDELEIDQEYINEQKIKKLLGVK